MASFAGGFCPNISKPLIPLYYYQLDLSFLQQWIYNSFNPVFTNIIVHGYPHNTVLKAARHQKGFGLPFFYYATLKRKWGQ